MSKPLRKHDDSTSLVHRRTLLKALPLMGMGGLVAYGQSAARRADPRMIRYAGWQVGVTYQAAAPGGMNRDDLMRLLDEMTAQRMNLLSLMMISYGYFDPNHDGYCWPVRNAKLKPYWDDKSINGRPETEFVGEVIQAAADRGVEIQLFMNWGIWNPRRIGRGYPTACPQVSRKEAQANQTQGKGWLHCPDSPGAWQAGLDEVADFLTFYDHPNVKSYCLERISYSGSQHCFCPHTQQHYQEETGRPLLEADPKDFLAWKAQRIGGLLKQYAAHIRRVRPNTDVWLHTQCSSSWGHDPATMQANGIDCLSPHTIQFRETRDQIYAKLDRLAPNPCVLHFCTRDQRPQNYNLWIKTPEILAEVFGWVRSYPGDNLAGLLLFNPNATSPRNRQAAYEQLKHFHWPHD